MIFSNIKHGLPLLFGIIIYRHPMVKSIPNLKPSHRQLHHLHFFLSIHSSSSIKFIICRVLQRPSRYLIRWIIARYMLITALRFVPWYKAWKMTTRTVRPLTFMSNLTLSLPSVSPNFLDHGCNWLMLIFSIG